MTCVIFIAYLVAGCLVTLGIKCSSFFFGLAVGDEKQSLSIDSLASPWLVAIVLFMLVDAGRPL